jgi:hypothetical protein
MDCTLALVARGRPMKIVCDVLGVARSNLYVRAHRLANWTDRRRHRRPSEDGELVAEITTKGRRIAVLRLSAGVGDGQSAPRPRRPDAR